LGVKRALVVTDPGVAALPFFAGILASLKKPRNIAAAVFKDVHPDPLAADVIAGVRRLCRA
jgi:alcohol dehydrogenase class IV